MGLQSEMNRKFNASFEVEDKLKWYERRILRLGSTCPGEMGTQTGHCLLTQLGSFQSLKGVRGVPKVLKEEQSRRGIAICTRAA